MILCGFIDKPYLLASWIFQRQWAEWEIITIAVIVVFVVLWIMKGQRKRAYRNIYENQFLESTPVIGTKLGTRKQRRRLVRNYKKTQTAAVKHDHTSQQKPTKRTEKEKLQEQIRQLQREIIKHKKSEVRLEEKVVYLTSVNEKLQHELAGLKQAEQPAEIKDEVGPASEEQLKPEIPEESKTEQSAAQEPATEEKEQPVIAESGQIQQEIEVHKAEEPAKDERFEMQTRKRGKTYEQLHRIVDDIKQKLCRKCNEWKPESEFHKNASSRDGLAGSCKKCKAEAAKEYRRRRKNSQD